MNVLDRARRIFDKRPEGTPGQLDQERETAVSLGLMADAKAAGAEMTDEQAIFLSSSIAGMNARIAYLRGPDVPKPLSLAQERELTMIERELARLEGRDEAKPVLVAREDETRPSRFLGAVAAHPVAALLLSPWTWLVISLGLLGLQTGRIGNLQDDVRDARADLAMAERNAADLATTNQRLTEEVNNANRDASQSAANWQAERDRRLRAQQEARRIRDAMDQARTGEPVDYGFGSVRDDGAVPPSAPGGDPSGRDPG